MSTQRWSKWIRNVGIALGLAGLTLATPLSTIRAQAPQLLDTRLDVTRNTVVNAADAWSAISAWRDLTERGQCYAVVLDRYDVDGNACIDVADVQKVLAHWGEATGPSRNWLDSSLSPAQTFTVNSDGDQSDASPGNGVCETGSGNGVCTLRAALEEANVRAGADTIQFNILDGGACPSLVTIEPSTMLELDDIHDAGITIDGYTQCGASANTQSVSGNAVIKIEIKGNATNLVRGIQVESSNHVIRGLAVYNWYRPIEVVGSATQNNTLAGNFIGTNVANTFKAPGAMREGVFIFMAGNTLIGGATPQARNILSGNGKDGVLIQGNDIDGGNYNRIIGNYIGLKQNGSSKLGNGGGDGVDIQKGPKYNTVGGLNPGERNVIAGNKDGVEVSHVSTTQYNSIIGNYIGVTADGTTSVANDSNGIKLEDLVNHIYIYNNVIAGNGWNGIRLYDSSYNEIHDNLIGVMPNGVTPKGNGTLPGASDDGLFGIKIENVDTASQHNLIQRNVIANHPDHGISLFYDDTGSSSGPTDYNTVSQNSIYSNGGVGIRLNTDSQTGVTPNQGLPAPNISSASSIQVIGSACANCLVEVFISDKTSIPAPGGQENSGEGKTFIGQGMANAGGSFSISVSGVAQGQLVTATATDASGNTSEFGGNVVVVGGPPPPTQTATPTATRTPTRTPTPTKTPKHRLWLPEVLRSP